MSSSSNENYTYSEYYKLYKEQKAKYEELSAKLKPKLSALSDKIEEIKEEMKPTKQIVEKYDTLIYDCYSSSYGYTSDDVAVTKLYGIAGENTGVIKYSYY